MDSPSGFATVAGGRLAGVIRPANGRFSPSSTASPGVVFSNPARGSRDPGQGSFFLWRQSWLDVEGGVGIGFALNQGGTTHGQEGPPVRSATHQGPGPATPALPRLWRA